jgi:very-short-patch-repair endonuclease
MSNKRMNEFISDCSFSYQVFLTDCLSAAVKKYPKFSPIEQLFYIAYLHIQSVNSDYERIFLSYSKPVRGESGKKYYPDFHFKTVEVDGLALVIELDGHDFHEKTKEQVRKDKERERDMTKAGYTILRYSGSEVYANPIASALEAVKEYKKRLDAVREDD